MFQVIAPCPSLAAYVSGYWFVRDLAGEYEGQSIETCPCPGAVLSVNFGRPNAMEGGPTVPEVSLLGLQTGSRRWRSWSDTYFVMAMLSVTGLVRLFPGIGADSRDRLLDLAGYLGDRSTGLLSADLSAAWSPGRIAHQLDTWFMDRLLAVPATTELPLLTAAHSLLRLGRQVQEVAGLTGIERRQLGRWFERHVGVSPKQLMDLERLQSSIQAVQRGEGDPLCGYSDQAHQIRSWRRRLARTPGGYAQRGPSSLAGHFGRPSCVGPAFYL